MSDVMVKSENRRWREWLLLIIPAAQVVQHPNHKNGRNHGWLNNNRVTRNVATLYFIKQLHLFIGRYSYYIYKNPAAVVARETECSVLLLTKELLVITI